MIDQYSECLLCFLGLSIRSLGLLVDYDFLSSHCLGRLLQDLLLEPTHLVVKLHILVISHVHWLRHYLLLSLIGEALSCSLSIEELVLEAWLTTELLLEHRWIKQDWSRLHNHSLLALLPILLKLSLRVLIKTWVLNVLHLVGVHELGCHHLLLLLVHILWHFHLLFAIILTKLLLTTGLQLLTSMGERASGTIWTISTSFVKLALHSFIIVSTVLEVTLEVLVSLWKAILLLLYHSTTSAVTSWHLLGHSSLPLEVLLTLKIASASSVVTWHAILLLLKASSHILPRLIIASQVSVSALRPIIILVIIIDWHSPHSCSFHMFRNWLKIKSATVE